MRVSAWIAHAAWADTRGLRHAIFRGGMFDPDLRPTGPLPGRVVRGGSRNNEPTNLRVAIRNRNQPDNRNNNLGFRVARTLPCRSSRVYGAAERAGKRPGSVMMKAVAGAGLGREATGAGRRAANSNPSLSWSDNLFPCLRILH